MVYSVFEFEEIVLERLKKYQIVVYKEKAKEIVDSITKDLGQTPVKFFDWKTTALLLQV